VVAPGALLHVDVKRLARFRQPGHRATGDRRELPRNRGVGYEYLQCVVDDHSRYAFVELHPREDGLTAARVLERALAELASVGARHIVIPPYTPRWNGKVEALIKTLLREWAQVRTWQSSSERARALSSFVRYYNRRRPHSSLGGRPPLSRVHNVCGSYS
jgi:transposase InsO family protein